MRKTTSIKPAAAFLAAILAAALLALAVSLAARPAEAAFPGENGMVAYYTSGDVWTMEPDGSGATKLTTNFNYEGNPAVSPDGSKIAYEFFHGIWVMNADGSDSEQLTDGSTTDEDPVFSDDGSKVVFTRNGDLWAMNSDGTSQANLTNTPANSERDPSFSPLGDKITYTRTGCDVPNGGGNCVYAMDDDGSNQTNLTPELRIPGCEDGPGYSHYGASREPAFSPDGERIVFSGSLICPNTLGRDIWTMNSDGSGKTNLTNDHGTGEIQPAFSPDGTKIVFVSDENSSNLELWTMNDDGSAMTRLTNDAIRQDNPDWSVPPLDTDGDGVPDYKDECPGVPSPGTADGCPTPPNTAPAISAMRPASGSMVRDTTPTISATVLDRESDLSKNDIQLYVDGRRKSTFSYKPSTGDLSHASSRLAKGGHTVKIVAADPEGKSAARSWNFKIK